MGRELEKALLFCLLHLATSCTHAGALRTLEGRWRQKRSLEGQVLSVLALNKVSSPSLLQCAARCAREIGCCMVGWRAGPLECHLYPDLGTLGTWGPITGIALAGARFYSWIDGTCGQMNPLAADSPTDLTSGTSASLFSQYHYTSTFLSPSHSYPTSSSQYPLPSELPFPSLLSESPTSSLRSESSTPPLPSSPTLPSLASVGWMPTMWSESSLSTVLSEESSSKAPKIKACGNNNSKNCKGTKANG